MRADQSEKQAASLEDKLRGMHSERRPLPLQPETEAELSTGPITFAEMKQLKTAVGDHLALCDTPSSPVKVSAVLTLFDKFWFSAHRVEELEREASSLRTSLEAAECDSLRFFGVSFAWADDALNLNRNDYLFSVLKLAVVQGQMQRKA